MSPVPWSDTGLPHLIRRVFTSADDVCANVECRRPLDPTNMLVDRRGYTFCDAGCADNDSHAAEQARTRRGYEDGLDVTNRPKRPADIRFGGLT